MDDRGPAECFFDAIARKYDRVYAPDATTTRARMGRILGELPPPPARILDLGVGTGRELGALQDGGYAPTGVDVSREMLAVCGRRTRRVPLVHADFWQPLPFPARAFDAALALHGTLAHPPDDGAPGRLAREIARVLDRGGVFVAEVPAPAWLERLDAGGPAVRTGPRTLAYRDPGSDATIEGTVLEPEAWAAAFDPAFTVRVDPLGPIELLVVAVKRGAAR